VEGEEGAPCVCEGVFVCVCVRACVLLWEDERGGDLERQQAVA